MKVSGLLLLIPYCWGFHNLDPLQRGFRKYGPKNSPITNLLTAGIGGRNRPTTRRILTSPFGNLSSADEVETERQSALFSMRLCYQAAFLSALVDGVSGLANRIETSSSPLFSMESFSFAPIISLWKFGFAAVLYWVRRRITDKEVSSLDDETLAQICTTMARLWRVTAGVIAAASSIVLVELLQDRVVPWVRVGVVLGLIAVVAATFRILSSTQTNYKKVILCPSNRGGAAQAAGLMAVHNMTICVGALCFRGAVAALEVAVTHAGTWTRIALKVLEVPTPFVTAGLLWKLRSSFVEALLAVTSTNRKKDETLDAPFSDLYKSQEAFYEKVAETLSTVAKVKVLLTMARLTQKLVKTKGGPV